MKIVFKAMFTSFITYCITYTGLEDIVSYIVTLGPRFGGEGHALAQ